MLTHPAIVGKKKAPVVVIGLPPMVTGGEDRSKNSLAVEYDAKDENKG